MTIRKLKEMPYAQAHVEIDDNGNIFLFSYTTLVAMIDSEGWVVIGGLYSMTTRKHIGAFMREYANSDYQTAKKIYEDGYRFNMYTGEVVDI